MTTRALLLQVSNGGCDQDTALFVLQYCVSDLGTKPKPNDLQCLGELPLLPLVRTRAVPTYPYQHINNPILTQQ